MSPSVDSQLLTTNADKRSGRITQPVDVCWRMQTLSLGGTLIRRTLVHQAVQNTAWWLAPPHDGRWLITPPGDDIWKLSRASYYKRTEDEPSQFIVCFVHVLKVYVNCRLE